MAPDSGSTRQDRRPLRWRDIRQAMHDLWLDYNWPVKLTLVLIVLASLWGMVVAGWPGIGAAAPPVVHAMTSDAAVTLLTFLIAFMIAVNFYIRARRGVLDGDEHYNIARALAFGYFKNFLVPALQLARREGRTLHVFRPTSMSELRQYSTEIEPRVRRMFEHQWLPLVDDPAPGGPPRRTVLALQAPRDGRPGEEPFYFDAPTALFTVNDFYAALNRRRVEDDKEPLNPETVNRYQNGQIDSFFRHLQYLFDTVAGYRAVADIVPDHAALSVLRDHYREVAVGDIEARYVGGASDSDESPPG